MANPHSELEKSLKIKEAHRNKIVQMAKISTKPKESVDEYLLSISGSRCTSENSNENENAASLEESTRSSESSESSAFSATSSVSEPDPGSNRDEDEVADADSGTSTGDMRSISVNNSVADARRSVVTSKTDALTTGDRKAEIKKIKHKKMGLSFLIKVIVGTFLMIPILFSICAFFPGIMLLLQYRAFFGSKAPITISPSHGVVASSSLAPMSHISDEYEHASNREDGPLFKDVDYHFKTYRRNPQLKKSLTQKPLRLLVVGDSIARGVGHSKSCYPTMPETIAAVLSEHHDGRPVYWTAFGEPGATMKWIANQAHSSLMDVNNDIFDKDNDQVTTATMDQFYNMHEAGDNVGANTNPTSRITEENFMKNLYTDDQKQWVQKLEYHRQLHYSIPFSGYDYIIALSGVNDIKRVAVPFLLEKEEDGTSEHTDNNIGIEVAQSSSGFHEDINRFIRNVKKVSKFHHQVCTKNEKSNCGNHGINKLPYIIFPSFPTVHVPAKTGPFVRWVAVQSTSYLDRIKKLVADEHPHHIYAVPCANEQDSLDFLNNKGSIWDALMEENIMLRLVRANGEVCRNLVEEMDKFYSKNMAKKEAGMLFEGLFSNDALHPNDWGYEYFGRHIGKQIIERWKDNNEK